MNLDISQCDYLLTILTRDRPPDLVSNFTQDDDICGDDQYTSPKMRSN